MMGWIALIFLLMGSSIGVAAQTIREKTADNQGKPLPYANVVLLSLPDSAFVAGTVSGEDGGFVLRTRTTARVAVRVSSVGYGTQTRTPPGNGDVGIVTLQPDNVMMGEVVVKASRPTTRLKSGTPVTSVENSMLAHAGTANDVPAQVPMVLGREGNFEVFGKGTPSIYVNDRQMQDLSELSQLNSADIKSVEVVTNPGAKYDASVKAVVRIRTKRPKATAGAARCGHRRDSILILPPGTKPT